MSVEEVNITKTLFAMVLGFTICWVPVFVIEFTDSATGNHSLPRRVYLLNVFLVSISSAINPVIYGVLNRTFRLEYYRMWPCCSCFSLGVWNIQREHEQNNKPKRADTSTWPSKQFTFWLTSCPLSKVVILTCPSPERYLDQICNPIAIVFCFYLARQIGRKLTNQNLTRNKLGRWSFP